MCSYITEKAPIFGSAKGKKGWMAVDTAVIYFDHPVHVPLDHALNIDFVDSKSKERVAVELSAGSARELIKRIEAALNHGESVHLGSQEPDPVRIVAL
jgi:hypothetical protein